MIGLAPTEPPEPPTSVSQDGTPVPETAGLTDAPAPVEASPLIPEPQAAPADSAAAEGTLAVPSPPQPTAPAEPTVPVPSWRPATSPGPFEPAFVPEGLRPVIPAAPEPAPPATVGIEVELSVEFLPALLPFLDATAAGHRGLAVVRELPERIRALVGPRPVAVYWLSNLVRDRTVRPGDLPGLATLLRQGVEANSITAVFLEGVEYLARIHGSNAVAGFLKELDQLARERDTRVWLHITPGLLSPAELDLVVADLPLPKGINRPDAPPPDSPPESN